MLFRNAGKRLQPRKLFFRSGELAQNTLIAENTAPVGAAIYNESGATPELSHVTVANNLSSGGGNPSLESALYNSIDSAMTLRSSIVWGNQPPAIVNNGILIASSSSRVVESFRTCSKRFPLDG